jgi:hypothetical protein
MQAWKNQVCGVFFTKNYVCGDADEAAEESAATA